MPLIRKRSVTTTHILSASGSLKELKSKDSLYLIEEECEIAAKKARQQGERIGFEQSKKELQLHFHLLQNLAQKILEQRALIFEKIKPEVIEFSMQICEKILRQKLIDKESLSHMITSLLDLALPHFNQEGIIIHLSPEDFTLIDKKNIQKELYAIQFIANPSIQKGDVRMETKSALLNFDISRELSKLKSCISAC